MTSERFEPVVREDGTFRVFAPVSLFEKADAPDGQKRRIGGIISTDTKDQQGEVILQQGLDLGPFVTRGHFNDNHSRATADIVGEPDPTALRFFKKGERLPNGETAVANGHWAEGWIYDDPRSDLIWQKAKAMAKSPGRRRLGFSIEGSIQRRTGPDMKTIAKAVVSNVAVTACPVNTDTRLDVLAKSLMQAELAIDHDAAEDQAREALGAAAAAADQVTMDGILDMDLRDRPVEGFYGHIVPAGAGAKKALSAGAPSTHRPSGAVSGAGAGRTLMPQSLEHDIRAHGVMSAGGITKSAGSQNLNLSQAISFVRARYPNISCATAGRIVDLTLSLKRRGQGGQHG